MRLAGLDVGTTRTRLVVFDEDLSPLSSRVLPSPAKHGEGELLTLHDSRRLGELARELAFSVKHQVAGLGVASYRASVLAWRPGGTPLSDVVLWSNLEERSRGVRSLPLVGRAARHLPVYGSILSPASPLPLISYFSRKHGRGARVWTVEAFLAEVLGAGYLSDEASAALSGLFKPHDLKPIPLAGRLAGLPPWFEAPSITPMIVEAGAGGGLLKALSPDQQAALVGLSCTRPGCVMVSLGTGGFVQAVVEKVPRVPRGGVIPIVAYSPGGRRVLGVEAHSLGLGMAVKQLVMGLGGFETLARLRPRECARSWKGSLTAFKPGGQGFFLSKPQSIEDAACGIVASIALEAAEMVWRLPLTPREYWLASGLSKIPLLGELLSTLLPSPALLKHYTGEASARGAALMAGVAQGIYNSPRDAPPPDHGELGGRCWDGSLAADDIPTWRRLRRGDNPGLRGALYDSLRWRLDCLGGAG